MERVQRRMVWFAVLLLFAAPMACSERRDADAPVATKDETATDLGAALRERVRNRPRITVANGRVSIVARDAKRESLLRRLAQKAGFELDARALPPLRITVKLEDVTLEVALAELLSGVEYHGEYRRDEARGADVLSRIVVGDAASGSARHPTLSSDGKFIELGRFRRPVDTRTPEERERERVEEETRDALAVEQLTSSSPEVRILGLEAVYVGGPGHDLVYRIAANDPDPATRALALNRIVDDDDSTAALAALHAALSDPSPEVVRAALAGLVVIGDESSVPYLERLLTTNLTPEIRRIAEHTLDFVK